MPRLSRVFRMQTIVVIESDTSLSDLLQRCFGGTDFAVRSYPLAHDVVQQVEPASPALIMIANTVPDAVDLCRRIRRHPLLARTPLICLTDSANQQESVLALEAGADDCIARGLTPHELVARTKAVLRRFSPPVSPHAYPANALTRLGDFEIDNSAMRVLVRGNEVTTTTLEFRLIDYLTRNHGRVFTRDELLDAVWGDTRFVTPRSVDTCIRRIREKIEPQRTAPTYLKTIRGVGYRLDAVISGHAVAP
ncbi:MAG: response regulator transcription factor [Acidobacteriia bacterium]|nr:response regulator transcription factor [Terriglobia bacterium]